MGGSKAVSRTAALTRAAGVAAIAAGIVIAISPFVFQLAGNGNGGERVTDRYRTTLSTQGLAQLNRDFNTVVLMGGQFFNQTLPDAQRQLHESPAQFRADLRTRFPAIADAQANVPPVVAIVQPRIPALLATHKDFEEVASAPFLGLPISSVPWLLLGIGIVVAGLGVVVLVWPTRAGAALVAVAGLALIGVPLAVDGFGKADAAV